MLLLLLLACPDPKLDDTAPHDSTPGETFACGESTCASTAVCVQERYEPTCENRTDTGEPCPEGTTATMCGGAGIACCCEPEPDPTYTCQDGCGDTPSCDCVTCASGKQCMELGSKTGRTYVCEEPPAP